MRTPEVPHLADHNIKQIEKIVEEQDLQAAALNKDDMVFLGEKVKDGLLDIFKPRIPKAHHLPEDQEI